MAARSTLVSRGLGPGAKNSMPLIFDYYQGSKLIYVARTRNGFTPASREKLIRRFRGIEIKQCPFANLPRSCWYRT
jgi:hypothetical protein